MEGDWTRSRNKIMQIYFNPLPPHGGRLYWPWVSVRRRVFQSTPSAWRETHWFGWRRSCNNHFNPLPPHGGRPAVSEPPFCLGTFQSTPSAWRETYIRMDIVTHQIFQSTPSAWRETQPIPIKPTKVTISIHSLRMEGDCHMFLTYPAA